MSWLLFLDESGHDHRHMPYEVRGGIALHVGKLWPFVRGLQALERNAFGVRLQEYSKELKGASLLDSKRFRFAAQMGPLDPEDRRRLCRSFLTKGLEPESKSTRPEFTAHGQACLEMARGIFELLFEHGAVLFASAVPRGTIRPPSTRPESILRKDQVFVLERFYYFLSEKRDHGILVMDESEKSADRKFVSRLERYFTRTDVGRNRAHWVVPTPFFVSSDMNYAVQAADLCIYCVNWGFRLPDRGMDAPVRTEIAQGFGGALRRIQFRGEGARDGQRYSSYGAVYVPDLYEPRE